MVLTGVITHPSWSILSLRYTTMCCLDIVRMIIPPRSAHSFRTLVVRDDIVVIREVFVADGAYPTLLDDLSVQNLPHLGR